LDHLVLDILSDATKHQALYYLQYCLVTGNSQLAAKAVMDIRTELQTPEKATHIYASQDLHILLCAHGIFTELVATPLLPHIFDSLFRCPCKQSHHTMQHTWRHFLITRVAAHLELSGYDELSAHLTARYFAADTKHTDSLATRASLLRAMTSIATRTEDAMRRYLKPLPFIHQLNDARLDGHTFHQLIVQALLI
jgi:hypothetical protein